MRKVFDETELNLKSSVITSFLGSTVTKGICYALIVGQMGLLARVARADLVLPQNQQERIFKAKSTANSKGYEWTRNLQNNALSTNITAGGDITFNSIKLDDSSNVSAAKVNNIKSTNGRGQESRLNLYDLSPDSSKCRNGGDCSKYYADGKLPNVQSLQGVYTEDASVANENAIVEYAQSSHDRLDADVKNNNNSNMSVQSHVYAIMNDTAKLNKPNLAEDPMFNNAKAVIGGSVQNVFSDCGKTENFIKGLKKTRHTTVYKSCVEDAVATCTLRKQPAFQVLGYFGTSGKQVFGSCGENCTKYYLGDMDHAKDATYQQHMTAGNCAAHTTNSTLTINSLESIKQVKITNITYAGTVKVKIDRSAPGMPLTNLFSYDAYGSPNNHGCVQNHAYVRMDLNLDITSFFKTKESNPIVDFTIEYTGAKPIIEVEVIFDPKYAINNDYWTGSDDCMNRAAAVYQKELEGTIECKDSLTLLDGYVYSNGIMVKSSALKSEYGLSSACTTAEVNVTDKKADFLKDMLLCSELRKNGCGYVSEHCEQEGYNGAGCKLSSYVYDCGYDNTISGESKAISCPGKVECQGKDCMNLLIKEEGNAQDFNKALALLNESQQSATEAQCTRDANNNLSCNFFPGERSECSNQKLLGMSNDCCDPDGMPMQDIRGQIAGAVYASKVFFVKDMAMTNDIFDNSVGSMDSYFSSAVGGSASQYEMGGGGSPTQFVVGTLWDVFKNYTGVGQTFTKVQNKLNAPIVNTLNNIIPYAGEIYAGVEDAGIKMIVTNVISRFVDEAMKEIYKQIAEFAAKQLGLDAAGGGGTAAGASTDVAANTMGAAMSACLMWIAIIYAVYCVAKLIVTIMIQCDEDEYTVAANIQQKLCDPVGGYCAHKFLGKCKEYRNVYCCFKSQLSRILNKQIRYSLKGLHMIYPNDAPALAWGGGKYASCNGLTLSEMQNANWKLVDLTEWLTLLKAAGKLSSDNINLDSLRDNYLPTGKYNSAGGINSSNIQPVK
ncbi:conjugal transfer protein TraN [Succinivibrio dextrinosolvens]|uniref:conjugal transfer protein TraN n=1 Tax=Succinivibrio dextrinosolvens TaxID=83771 RepID=UPI001923EAAF|nr:conjugal transfer protein TraN [Succinivibrio dextrinosolvens]